MLRFPSNSPIEAASLVSSAGTADGPASAFFDVVIAAALILTAAVMAVSVVKAVKTLRAD